MHLLNCLVNIHYFQNPNTKGFKRTLIYYDTDTLAVILFQILLLLPKIVTDTLAVILFQILLLLPKIVLWNDFSIIYMHIIFTKRCKNNKNMITISVFYAVTW